ncbi:putative cytochrome P450 [Aspergillus californicus]
MTLITQPLILLISLTLLTTWTICKCLAYIHHNRLHTTLGAGHLRKYPHKDPLLGLDYVYSMLAALRADRFFAFQTETYNTHGGPGKSWSATFLGNRMIYTSKPENMKAMSTSHADAFAVEPIRVGNGAITPFQGRGVSSSDGEHWLYSRNLVKPYFERGGFANLARLEGHVDRLLACIPTDGGTVDMQPLFQLWFLDTSTDFLFGQSVHSLTDPSKAHPQKDMVTVMRGLRLRLQLSSFVFLHRDSAWIAACKRIHVFLDSYIDDAYAQLKAEKEEGKPALQANGKPRDDFLWTIARHVPDKQELRTQLTGVWIPSNETTSILMSNTLFALARNPRVVEKLRKEILAYGDGPLTFEGLRSLNYLRWTVNETHRLYPVSLQTVRSCTKPTTLPTGGGASGNEPILCRKGDIVHCNRYLMHRDPELWGADAEEFVPERWEKTRPLWNFVPFGGGPRICPAHVMVDTECSYAVFRILQRFRAVEARDGEVYTPVMRVGPSNRNGCKVAFVPA